MSDQALLLQTAERLFHDVAHVPSLAFAQGWSRLEEAGFASLLLGEESGGYGGSFRDMAAVLRLAGLHALAAPLSEAMLASYLLQRAGAPPLTGLASLAPVCEGTFAHGRFSGVLRAVPWGDQAVHIVASHAGRLLVLERRAAEAVTAGQNPAGEPRASLRFHNAQAQDVAPEGELFALGAFSRTCLMAGALDAALALSIDYANTRVQFGKPIGRFQALQQGLAVFAEEAAAVNCAAQAAARALDHGDAAWEIAAAKLRANQAVDVGVATAHQVHGAIGFTAEHELHRLTSRLISWSAEFGTARYWAEQLGGTVSRLGAEALWPELTRRGDRS